MTPAFSVEIRNPPSGMFVLKCDHLAKCHTQPTSSNESHAMSTDYVQRRLRDVQQIVTMLQGNVVGIVEEEDDWDDEDEVDDFEEAYAL